MALFGNTGHVLTNTARNTNQSTENYTCIVVQSSGNTLLTALYKLDNTTGNQNIEYDFISNTWTANPSTGGNHDPSIFLSAGSNGSSVITPSNANTALHIGYLAGGTTSYWMATYSVDYTSSGNGINTLGDDSDSEQAPKKVHCNFW